MTLSTQEISRNGKCGPISSTYRAGGASMFGSCPKTCSLCSDPQAAASDIDHDYMKAVYEAVPRGGVAFTFTHFHRSRWAHRYPAKKGRTTINHSCDSLAVAKASLAAGVPTAMNITPSEYLKAREQGVKVKTCPLASISKKSDKNSGRNCSNCGGSRGPICAWPDRDFIVAFINHGSAAKRAADPQAPGGCYAESGYYTRLHWEQLGKRHQQEPDPIKVRAFAKSLPWGRVLRHHIAGDFGKV